MASYAEQVVRGIEERMYSGLHLLDGFVHAEPYGSKALSGSAVPASVSRHLRRTQARPGDGRMAEIVPS